MIKIAMVSECNFDVLVPDVTEEVRAALWQIWLEDMSAKMDKVDLIVNANGLLTYFGSKVLLTDVDWDVDNGCFIWEQELAS
jgi:hypothetical protein